nr:LysR substrate-binding domain-containing protein [Sinorhizobium fredii]
MRRPRCLTSFQLTKPRTCSALLSDWNIADDLKSRRLLRVTLADAEPETLAISAVYPTSRLVPPKVRVFIDELMSALSGIKISGT